MKDISRKIRRQAIRRKHLGLTNPFEITEHDIISDQGDIDWNQRIQLCEIGEAIAGRQIVNKM